MSSNTSLPLADNVIAIVNPGFANGMRPWLPGQSGNKQGRPTHKIMSDSLSRKLMERPNPESPETRADVIAESVVKAAEKGDVQCFTAIRDTVDGRPAQQISLDANISIESQEERKARMVMVLTALASLGVNPDE
jgi:hypothetical protein